MSNKKKELEKNKKEKKEQNNSKYYFEEEKIKTIFSKKENNEKIEIDKKEQSENISQKNKNYVVKSQLIQESTDSLSPISVSKEMKKSFLEYAMSVIVSRALPDARDGLKPVHRRILYGMFELGLSSSTKHKKSARVVGDVLGKYHPHGDTSVYEAMVRMAQKFSMRYPLVDGQGNFGSIDGDSAAAMRYTEARMSKIAFTMVDGIRKNTVNFIPNYDDSDKEPSVLPSRIPNLLITGATGIAVGMATNIPPHNLREIINGLINLAKKPEININDLMQFITGPDFPTGGIILGSSGIKNGYEIGKGSIPVRSKTRIEQLKNGKSRIIVEEIPYMVNKANMIEKIAQLAKNKVVEGITDLRDESSREGIRIVIDVKREVFAEVLLNKLFKLTQLQTNFSMNFLALVDGEPKTLNLKKALQVYLKHQKEVVRRRTQFDFDKAFSRSHILEGLKISILNIDLTIKIIKASKNDQEALELLINKFNLSKIQAKSIIEMKLGRLTGLAIEKMNQEIKELQIEINKLKNILNNPSVLLETIIKELEEIKEKFKDERRSQIVEGIGLIEDEDLIPQKDIVITMSTNGYVKRIALEEYQVQNRGGMGSNSMKTYEDDDVKKIITTNTHTDLLIFTSHGKVYKIRTYQIPELSKQAKGIPFINIISIKKDEKIISLLPIKNYQNNKYLITITKGGIIKKTKISEYSKINRNGKIALKLKENDHLIKVIVATNENEIIIGNSIGKVVRFDCSSIRSLGRTSTGVKGMNIINNSFCKVIGASIANDDLYIFSVGKDGFGKKTVVSEYRKTNRGAKGVTSININKAGELIFVDVVNGKEDVLIITKKGITIRMSLEQVATSSRSTKGVKIISLKNSDSIKSISVINNFFIEEKVKKAIELEPNNIDTYLNKGMALYNLKKYHKAIECFDKAIELEPNNIDAYNKKGINLGKWKKYPKAIECFNKAIKLNLNDYYAHYNKGITLNELKKYEEAIKCFDEAIKLQKNNFDFYNDKGITLEKLKKYDEAIKCFNKAIELEKNSFIAHNNKAIILNKLKKYDEAIEFYNLAIKLEPNNWNIYNNKGTTLAKLKKYEEAIKCFDQAIKLNSNDFEIYYNKGEILKKLEKNDKAIDFFDKTIKLNKKHFNAYLQKGLILGSLKKYKKAIKCFEKTIELNPNNFEAILFKGISLDKSGKYKEAIKCFNKTIKLKPKYSNSFLYKAISLAKLKKYPKAIKCFDKAIELNPNNFEFYLCKGIVLDEIKEYDEAINCYDKAIELNPNNSNSYNNKGITLEKLKKYDEAIKFFNKAIELNPNVYDAYHNKGIILNELKKHEESIQYFNRKIELKPNNTHYLSHKNYLYTK